MSLFGFGEIEIAIVVGAIILFFGRNKVMEWIKGFKEVKEEYQKPSVKA